MTDNSYPGGKNGSGTYQTIINQIPPHDHYYELFLGGGAILANKLPAAQSTAIDLDPTVIHRWTHYPPASIPNLELIHYDTLEWLDQRGLYFDRHNDFIYLDPPYPMTTRSSQRTLYSCEMTDDQHRRLLNRITNIRCKIAISSYHSDMYANALSSWRHITFQSQTHGGPRTEHLWMNYPAPLQLHDYRYIGDDYRERERIKKKITRWKTRLRKMPTLERQALLSAIEQEFT